MPFTTFAPEVSAEELAAIRARQAQSPVPYSDLATSANQFMTGQALAPFLQNLPNYANMVGQRSENTLSNLKGELNRDVINQISQGSAERGISSGMTGGPNTNSAYLRALGLNSLQLQNQGSQDLSASIRDTPVPELWNPMSLYVPQTLANQELEQARAGMAAAPTSYPQPRANGGVTYTGQTSGMGRTAPIQRNRNEGTIIGRTQSPTAPQTSFSSQLPQSSYDNWWNTYGSSGSGGGQSQDYWNSPAGLQNPDRPADEMSLDDSISNLTSIMSGLPEFLGGGDWWNQSAPQQVNQYGGYGDQNYGPAPDFGDYWDDYSDDGGNDWTDLFGP